MSKKVIFNGNLGNSFARKRRRMPGTNKKFTPEIKAWDCMNPANSTIGTTDQFEIHEFGNLCSFAGDLPAGYHYSWFPVRLQFPSTGANSYQKNGERFLFKYLKIKGYVQVMRRCSNPINWRLVMIRWDNATNVGFNRSSYISMFKMFPSFPSGDAATVDGFTQWGVKSFYDKIKNPDMASRFKRKVIASGHIPSCANDTMSLGTYAASSDADRKVTDSRNQASFNMTGEVAMYMPLDITVTVNDNLDSSVNYYLLLETDVVYGIDDTVYGYQALAANQDRRVMTILKDQFTIKFFTKGYFEDY